jgi:hypothetical protein
MIFLFIQLRLRVQLLSLWIKFRLSGPTVLKVVMSSLLRALKTLAPPEFIRLRGRIKAANKDVLLSALDQSIRGGEAGRRRART